MKTTSDAATLDAPGATRAVGRIRRGLRRHGFVGSLRLAGALLTRLAYLRESHVWYLLALAGDRSWIPLPAGMEAGRATDAELGLLAELPTVSLREARRRVAAGAEPWLVRDGARAVFACWIFRDRVPALAAPGGWLELPPGVVGLEDSITSPAYRGRGIAPAAYCAIAGALARDGAGAILTKIEPANVPVQRALEKAGFHSVAAMRLRRTAMRSRVEVRLDGGSEAGFLVERLAR